jgi:hypothetical protein
VTDFRIIDSIRAPQTIARGRQIRELKRIRKAYGKGRWRKLKGIAKVRLSDGSVREAEVHWYEAAGVGRKEFKIKSYLDVRE